jgi:hypothetical protein
LPGRCKAGKWIAARPRGNENSACLRTPTYNVNYNIYAIGWLKLTLAAPFEAMASRVPRWAGDRMRSAPCGDWHVRMPLLRLRGSR